MCVSKRILFNAKTKSMSINFNVQYKYFYLYNILTLYILSPPNKYDYIANVCCFAYLSPFVCSEHKNTDKSDLDLEWRMKRARAQSCTIIRRETSRPNIVSTLCWSPWCRPWWWWPPWCSWPWWPAPAWAPPVSVTRTAPPPAAPGMVGVSGPSQVTSRRYLWPWGNTYNAGWTCSGRLPRLSVSGSCYQVTTLCMIPPSLLWCQDSDCPAPVSGPRCCSPWGWCTDNCPRQRWENITQPLPVFQNYVSRVS